MVFKTEKSKIIWLALAFECLFKFDDEKLTRVSVAVLLTIQILSLKKLHVALSRIARANSFRFY